MVIYLIRHGETVDNSEKKFCGHTDSALSDIGKSQIKKLSDRLKDYRFDKVYSSPLQRALITAKEITGNVIIDEGFKEINFGDFEGKTLNEIKTSSVLEYEKFICQDSNYRFPNGESTFGFSARIQKTLEDIISSSSEDDNIALVSHSGVIREIISYLISKDDSLKWSFQIDNCSITKITYKENFATINYLNLTEHLR
ncbi:alpha-ribazole phosphatase [Acetoanaerobium pronyense]|uniref:Alpha-ribazole phosphatase n=1 Tax=Acetoanaerobium pronyense TaxID=1482736 RepID=A0ABS4KGV6_9FIRM|nr:histidine phosphatase family protein [Acetoanaerobium pronyense]MBP2026990.1 alpha-ribazole phosphatase [Acetoanaerobium pronyense]